jgi:SAM-dependent methyltransferase
VTRWHGSLEVQITAKDLEVERRFAAGDRLVAETRALPYMAADVFSVRDEGPAGRVLGYTAGDDVADADAYRAFEDLFRGSEEFIAARQRRYLELVAGCSPAVDIGCGRGEFLDLMAEAGIEAIGVDMDDGMVDRCRAKGHADTVVGDGVAYLHSRDDASLGLVFSAQVVEHLPPAVLEDLLAAAARKLRPGGLFIAETVNPHSVPALKTFWMDITHQHPLFPEAMLGWVRIAGFSSAYVFHPNGTGDVEVDRYTTTIEGRDGPMAPTINDPRSRVDFTKVIPPGETVRLFGTKHVLP